MARITNKFFRNGVDNQRQADFIVDLKRPDKFRLSTWSPDQKEEGLKWIKEQEKKFDAFKGHIIEFLNHK
jgi:hypothetical protein